LLRKTCPPKPKHLGNPKESALFWVVVKQIQRDGELEWKTCTNDFQTRSLRDVQPFISPEEYLAYINILSHLVKTLCAIVCMETLPF
jgi:hypothetical protein